MVSLAAASKSLPYDTLLSELEIGSVRELETKIGKVLTAGFDDCATIFAGFKR